MLAVRHRVSRIHPPSFKHVESNINLDLQHRPRHTEEHVSSEDESEDEIPHSVSDLEEVNLQDVVSPLIGKMPFTNGSD